MNLTLVTGSASARLGARTGALLEAEIADTVVERFPDGECHVAIGRPIRGKDVYVLQSTGPSVDEHLVELLLLVDACRRSDARRITVIIPYYGYARQDRRRAPGEPVAARVVADLLNAVHADRVLVVDPHTPGLEALFAMPVHTLSAVPLLAGRLAPYLPLDAVVVAPDLGAVKLAEQYAALLGRPTVVVRKRRLSGSAVHVEDVVGDVEGRTPLLIDDMITTGATIQAAARAVREQGAHPELMVAATHGVFVGPAQARLHELAVDHLVVSDTLPPPTGGLLAIDIVSIDRLLADAITRLHDDKPLDDLMHYV